MFIAMLSIATHGYGRAENKYQCLYAHVHCLCEPGRIIRQQTRMKTQARSAAIPPYWRESKDTNVKHFQRLMDNNACNIVH
jgi:hypothetical protein